VAQARGSNRAIGFAAEAQMLLGLSLKRSCHNVPQQQTSCGPEAEVRHNGRFDKLEARLYWKPPCVSFLEAGEDVVVFGSILPTLR